MINNKINNLKKRKAKELRFKFYGKIAIAFTLTFLVILFSLILWRAYPALLRSQIALNIDLKDYQANSDLEKLDYNLLVKKALRDKFQEAFDQTIDQKDLIQSYQILSRIASFELKEQIVQNPQFLGSSQLLWFSMSSKADMYFKYNNYGNFSAKQLQFLRDLEDDGHVQQVFNWQFFKNADSREAEIAGIAVGLGGSLMVMLIFLILAFPIAVMCAFYLEEFAKKNRLTDIIEISINNLAAIPSIIYGLLGLVLYLQIMHLPRSSSLVGGMTLFMLVLPVIIIATRNTIRSIPQTIRDGAYGLGASKLQVTLHHLLPLSIPGIMTGTILAISRALGETAPLLMIGMVAFIADPAQNFFDPATVLPVQIFLWSDLQENGFIEKTALAILMLLMILFLFNLTAIILRKKFEKKW
ncbi:phosphate transport system permease protein PstA [Alphaproteobacteria bacterium]|nr:phosphate transport system permease protein PstA [Alphaproteobacteria bacterium]